MQNYGLTKRGKTCINFSVPEVKILSALSFFVIFGIVTVLDIGINMTEDNAFLEDVLRYATCQLGGYNPMCEDIRRQFEMHLHLELDAAFFLCFGLLCWINLLFAVQFQDFKRFFQGMATCCHHTVKVLSFITKSTHGKSVNSAATPEPTEP